MPTSWLGSSRNSKSCPFIAGLVAILSIGMTSDCGSGSGSPVSPIPGQHSQVVLLATTTANDQLTLFGVAIASVTLIDRSGKSVTIFESPSQYGAGIEWMHLNGAAEPISVSTVPQAIYTSAEVTIDGCVFTNFYFNPPDFTEATYSQGLCSQGTGSSTVNLAQPISISGSVDALSLDLQVSKSYTLTGSPGNFTYTISPVFNLSAIPLAAQPKNDQEGAVSGVQGMISTTDSASSSFSLQTPAGIAVNLVTNPQTEYIGAAGFSSLAANQLVNFDAAIQPDGTFVATRVEVQDPGESGIFIGPILFPGSQPGEFFNLSLQEQNCQFSSPPPVCDGAFVYSASTSFSTSSQFSNLQILPFTPNFSAATLLTGQNAAVITPGVPNQQSFEQVGQFELMPQTLNGTVTAVTNSNGFAVYTVSLASYDLIPVSQSSGSVTLRLSNPSTVIVYADSNTQLLTTSTPNVGSLLRFRGLLFDDNGTMRMDCDEILDGVPE